jgi:hypothetical protein
MLVRRPLCSFDQPLNIFQGRLPRNRVAVVSINPAARIKRGGRRENGGHGALALLLWRHF